MEYLKEYVVQMVQFDKKTFGYEIRQELVRCKDCLWNTGTKDKPYCQHHGTPRTPEWFCASGVKDINVRSK